MDKRTKAALAGLAFFAGCEIGIAIQLVKMIHKFTVKESAMESSIPDDAGYELPESETEGEADEETAEMPDPETAGVPQEATGSAEAEKEPGAEEEA